MEGLLAPRSVDELGYSLLQQLYWHNPAKVPAPAQRATVRRVRVTPAVEQIYWLSAGDRPRPRQTTQRTAFLQPLDAAPAAPRWYQANLEHTQLRGKGIRGIRRSEECLAVHQTSLRQHGS